jgi:hypothetical protein
MLPGLSEVQGVGHCGGDPHRLVYRELLLRLESFPQGLPFHVRHHVVEEGIRLSRVVQRQDIRVLKVRRGLDLGQEALAADHRRELRLEDFEGDAAVVLQVLGQVDRGHAALAELTLDAVAALESVVQPGDGIGHELVLDGEWPFGQAEDPMQLCLDARMARPRPWVFRRSDP